ncbi:TetR/AcrR family transcriptional regulator [Pedobacter cryoconitis]|uniref:AcrR family transcriptional regulator n=1 Tax=Pedobacter cryoconitis TaxID=188932 RepID=A0A7X0J5K2_9SPHI|nr:TetR/AcrR family transcriptional regulator [Pedobacter cryoconitis]MBB6500767.1 AcrR family transcriptional regulator [Pedobacter cryoconitis]
MDNGISKAERTRQFIIETTAGIFNTKGYAGTSLSDLTEATQLTKGSIYGNFENKEDVALAVFDYNLSRVRLAIANRMQLSTSYHDKLMVYAQVYHSFSGEAFPPGGCPILNTAIEADDTNTLLKERAERAVSEWKNNIKSLIQAGIKSGEFSAGTEVDRLAYSIVALIEGGIMIAKITGDHANLDKVLKTVELLIVQLKA